MGYRLKAPFQSGGVNVLGQHYEVENWLAEVRTLDEANTLTNMGGYIMMPMDRWRLPDVKNVVVERGRGLGDVLMALVVCREMKRLRPDIRLVFACDAMFMELCQGLPYIDMVVSLPQVQHQRGKDGGQVQVGDGQTMVPAEVIIGMEWTAENAPDAHLLHRIDIFARQAGIEAGTFSKRLDLRITDAEAQEAVDLLHTYGVRPGDRVLGLGLRTTCFNRNMPGTQEGEASTVNREIAALAARDGWRVVLLDHDARYGWAADGVINLAGRVVGDRQFRRLAGLLSRCDLYIGPDTGTWHMASALNVPNLVYFGAINFKLRVTGERTRVLYRSVNCYPCDRYDCRVQDNRCMAGFQAGPVWASAADLYAQLKDQGQVVRPWTGQDGYQTVDQGATGPFRMPSEVRR